MISAAACLTLSILSQTPPVPATPPLVEWKVTGASLFKNGYGVVFREAEIPAGKTLFHTPPPGQASLGSVWFTASRDVKIQRIATVNRTNTVTTVATGIPEILALNVGAKLTLHLLKPGTSGQMQVEAEIKDVLPNLIVIKTASGEEILPIDYVKSLSSASGLKIKRDGSISEQALEFEARGPAGSKLYSMAIQSGISWSPAYSVQLLDNTKLRLTGQATLINDLAPISGAEIKLVTGFPSLRFLYQPDPLTADFLSPRMPGGSGGFGGGQMQNAAPITMRRESAESMADAFNPSGEGFAAEDLFFYKLPGTTLMQGGRSQTVLFEGTADYKAVYKAELPDPISQAGGRVGTPPDVWHTLVFKNPVNQPLTTAPAITMKSGEVIGQDEIKYSSVGGPVSLRVGKALDVVIEATAEEVEREQAARKDRHGNPTYDLITIKGVVAVNSLKGKDVQLEVEIPLEGEVISAGAAQVTKTAAGLRDANPRSLISWKPVVAKGGKVTLEYSVKIFVAAR